MTKDERRKTKDAGSATTTLWSFVLRPLSALDDNDERRKTKDAGSVTTTLWSFVLRPLSALDNSREVQREHGHKQQRRPDRDPAQVDPNSGVVRRIIDRLGCGAREDAAVRASGARCSA